MVLLNYIVMCLIFGTTFLAIKVGVDAGAPPFSRRGFAFSGGLRPVCMDGVEKESAVVAAVPQGDVSNRSRAHLRRVCPVVLGGAVFELRHCRGIVGDGAADDSAAGDPHLRTQAGPQLLGRLPYRVRRSDPAAAARSDGCAKPALAARLRRRFVRRDFTRPGPSIPAASSGGLRILRRSP